MNYKDLLYSMCCLLFAIIIGAAVYEHLSIVPRWSAAPPRSLAMFQGEFGLNAAAFWTAIHPVSVLFFLISLFLSWRTARRSNLLIVFSGYVLILLTTAIYFVPELLSITSSAYSDEISDALTRRASKWEWLSLLRLLILVFLSFVLFLGLTKPSGQTLKVEGFVKR